MTRENYGTWWEVDHVDGLINFDLKREDHQRQAFHYTNLQPLWWDLNRRKSKDLPTREYLQELEELKRQGYKPSGPKKWLDKEETEVILENEVNN